ncbi:hypothetical protein D9M71_70320 [compost metagenome]
MGTARFPSSPVIEGKTRNSLGGNNDRTEPFPVPRQRPGAGPWLQHAGAGRRGGADVPLRAGQPAAGSRPHRAGGEDRPVHRRRRRAALRQAGPGAAWRIQRGAGAGPPAAGQRAGMAPRRRTQRDAVSGPRNCRRAAVAGRYGDLRQPQRRQHRLDPRHGAGDRGAADRRAERRGTQDRRHPRHPGPGPGALLRDHEQLRPDHPRAQRAGADRRRLAERQPRRVAPAEQHRAVEHRARRGDFRRQQPLRRRRVRRDHQHHHQAQPGRGAGLQQPRRPQQLRQLQSQGLRLRGVPERHRPPGRAGLVPLRRLAAAQRPVRRRQRAHPAGAAAGQRDGYRRP